jgi:hypothetical protein
MHPQATSREPVESAVARRALLKLEKAALWRLRHAVWRRAAMAASGASMLYSEAHELPSAHERPSAPQPARPAVANTHQRSRFIQMQWDEASRQHTVLEQVEERALSPALTEALNSVYKRGSHASGIARPRTIASALIGALVVPLVAAAPYFLVPHGRASEQLTFASQWRYHIVVLPLGCFTVYTTCTFVLLADMNVPATRRLVVGCSCSFCLVYLSIEWVVSQLWAFPVPMGYVWIAMFGSTSSSLWLVHEVHGLRRLVRDRALLLSVSCQLGLSVLVIMFLVAFTTDVNAAMAMSATEALDKAADNHHPAHSRDGGEARARERAAGARGPRVRTAGRRIDVNVI